MAGNKNDYFFRLFQRRSRPIHYFFFLLQIFREAERERESEGRQKHYMSLNYKSVQKCWQAATVFFPAPTPLSTSCTQWNSPSNRPTKTDQPCMCWSTAMQCHECPITKSEQHHARLHLDLYRYNRMGYTADQSNEQREWKKKQKQIGVVRNGNKSKIFRYYFVSHAFVLAWSNNSLTPLNGPGLLPFFCLIFVQHYYASAFFARLPSLLPVILFLFCSLLYVSTVRAAVEREWLVNCKTTLESHMECAVCVCARFIPSVLFNKTWKLWKCEKWQVAKRRMSVQHISCCFIFIFFLLILSLVVHCSLHDCGAVDKYVRQVAMHGQWTRTKKCKQTETTLYCRSKYSMIQFDDLFCMSRAKKSVYSSVFLRRFFCLMLVWNLRSA